MNSLYLATVPDFATRGGYGGLLCVTRFIVVDDGKALRRVKCDATGITSPAAPWMQELYLDNTQTSKMADYKSYLAANILSEDRVVCTFSACELLDANSCQITYRLLSRALKINVNAAKE